MSGILAGMRVIEVSAFVAAPLAGMALAQLGADVIRVDPLGGGIDYGRWPVTGDGHSLYWAGLNKGKQSVALDLRTEEGREAVRRLATAPGEDGGILLTNLAPSWLRYEELARRRPDLIMVVLSGNPDGGVAVDYTVNAAVGYPLITGDGERPVNHVLPAWDVVAGHQLVTAVLAAERHRSRTGHGQLCHLSLADVALATVAHLGHLAEVEVGDADREAHGNYVFGQFGRDFTTADGRRVMVAALTARQWRSLMAATSIEEEMAWLEREMGWNLYDEGDRFRARHEIAAAVERWCAGMTLAELREAFDREGVLWGPYQSFRQLLADDPRASLANPMFTRIDQPGIGGHLAPATPLAFAGAPRLPAAPAPQLGEHTRQVLAEVAGYSAAELAALAGAGVL